jgi:hypothetical protein
MEMYVGTRVACLRKRAVFFLIVMLCILSVTLSIFTPFLPARALRESVNQPVKHRVVSSPSQNDPETMQALLDNENQSQPVDKDITENHVKQQKHITLSAYKDSAITIAFQDISPTAKRRRSGSSQ